MVQVTIETTGTMLVGTDIAAATAIVDALGVPIMGLNCATGPKEMAEHVRPSGARPGAGLISCLPNAGLPELRCGHTHYPLGADELAAWLERFVAEDGVDIVGGCCGTTAEHIARARRACCAGSPRTATGRGRSARAAAAHAVAGLAVLRRAAAPGERVPRRSASAATPTARRNSASCRRPATGTAASPWAASRSREGSNALDVCTAFVGRDEVAEMTEVVDAHARPGRQPAGDRFRPSCRCWRRRSSSTAARPC